MKKPTFFPFLNNYFPLNAIFAVFLLICVTTVTTVVTLNRFAQRIFLERLHKNIQKVQRAFVHFYMGKNCRHITARIQRLHLPINDKQRFCSNVAHLVGERFNWVPSPHCQKFQVKAAKIMALKREIFSCVSSKHLELFLQSCFFL